MARKTAPPKQAAVTIDTFQDAFDRNLAIALEDPTKLPGFGETAGNPVQLAPSVPEATTIVKKMTDGVAAAGQRYLDNVLRPKKEPLVEAAKANPRYKASMQAALANDSFLKGVQNADEAMMYDTIRAMGYQPWIDGVIKRTAKIQGAWDRLRPLLIALKATIDAMPNVTDADREGRMLAAVRGMRKIGVTLKTTK